VQRLQPQTERLVEVLRTYGENLKSVIINWTDEYPEAIEPCGGQLNQSVLSPFSRLRGIEIRLGKLKVAGRLVTEFERLAYQEMIDRALKQLFVGG
jgi:hypothetical protein